MIPLLESTAVFIEIGQSSLQVLEGDDGLELPLERSASGQLTIQCRERITQRLREYLKKKNHWLGRPRAFCAITARGVSLRRLTLPASSLEELSKLVALQIESQFPLSPDELAWGYRPLHEAGVPRAAANGTQEVLVVAVKKEVIDDYAQVVAACGFSPVFTLGALARSAICPQFPGACAVLDIGRLHSELISMESGVPAGVRVLKWGGESLTRGIERGLNVSRDEAEILKLNFRPTPASNADAARKIQASVQAELEALAALINRGQIGQKLYLTGKSCRLHGFAPALAKALGGGVDCQSLEFLRGEGRSAAILGLKNSWENNGASPLLAIEAKATRGAETIAQPSRWKWAAAAILLAVVSIGLRYAEPVFHKSRLSKRLTEVKAYREKLPNLDRELNFLQYLKTNQPPYIDAIHALANAAPPGTRIDSLSMSRSGDLALRGSMQNPQGTIDFRSKLIDSGLFSTVVVDEQTPSPDRQKVTFRITAQWKHAGARAVASTNAPASVSTNVPPSVAPGKPAPSGKDAKPDSSLKTNTPPPTAPQPALPTGATEPRRSAAIRTRTASTDAPGRAALPRSRLPVVGQTSCPSCPPVGGASLIGPSGGKMLPELAGWQPSPHLTI